jgi:ABC-type amino acid transport system permease subunit
MKRSLPLILAFLVGFVVILSEFIPHRPFNQIVSTLEQWFMIISGFAILLGQISLIRMNTHKIVNKLPDWQYYIARLISYALMLIFGILWGMQETPGLLVSGEGISSWLGAKPFDYLFTNAYMPLSATLFSLLAFFIASAAYRAFIIRGLESNLLMITAVIVIIGRTSIGTMLTGWLPESMQFWHFPILQISSWNTPILPPKEPF